MTELFAKILRQRGLDEAFLRPNYADLFDPYEMGDMEVAVARIEQARAAGEKIVVYGDYDVDGVTASAVMREGLEYFGCEEVEIILPDRFLDGYGLGETAISEIEASGASLVITVDCGSGSEEVIRALSERGVETIVTDHHEIPEPPRSAVAVVNPKRQGEKYGRRLAGVGVAFMVARALNMRKNRDDAEDARACDGQEKWLLDLVALGTLCDAMELLDENRILAYFGFKVIARTRREGLKELAERAGVDLGKINAHAVGFQLGPRLNAAGRMENAKLALTLLLAKNRREAILEAEKLELANKARREAQDEALGELTDLEECGDAVIVVQGKWHEGVIGIIAGKLSEKYKKPVFVLTELEGGVLKGSGRSFGEFSLAEALRSCSEGLLLSGGGHALACGVSIRAADFETFKGAVNSYYRSLGLENQERFLAQKAELILEDFRGLDLDFCEEIGQLEPFGEGNPEPVFEIRVLVLRRRVLKEKHLSLLVQDERGKEMKMMAFFAPEEWLEVKESKMVKLQFTLSLNEWRGKKTVEGSIVGLE